MGVSPSHRFGQIIGDTLESAVTPLLRKFAKKHGLYLDHQGSRPCRNGKSCSWVDGNGNSHDLDFVLERGGVPERTGDPVAFIETAWRRYTKHSRNKAQEIQGAILPLADRYRAFFPFKGAVLAGLFTAGALKQLESLGFTLLYLPYEAVLQAFNEFGIDARFDEDTPDADFERKVAAYERLPERTRAKIPSALLRARHAEVKRFLDKLTISVTRKIERILVLPLHGASQEVTTVQEAIAFIENYSQESTAVKIERYEIQIRYDNGDVIEGKFRDKAAAIDFLRVYEPRGKARPDSTR